jgi:hypothetical protein
MWNLAWRHCMYWWMNVCKKNHIKIQFLSMQLLITIVVFHGSFYFKYRINLDLFRMLQNFVDTLYWNLSQNLSVKISKQHLKLFMYFRFEGCLRFSLLVLIRKKTLFVPKDLYQYRWWEISLTKKCETVKSTHHLT